MAANRVGGILTVLINGERQLAKGNFTYNLGRNNKEAVIGHDEVHGYKELPQVSFIEGEITDTTNLDLAQLADTKDATITLRHANGKSIILSEAWAAGEFTGNTEEGNIGVRFEGKTAIEV